VRGKVALVTGAHRGIGAACALALAEQGAKLILADRLDCAETAKAIPGSSAHSVDVSDEASVLALFKAAQAQHPRLDILVHCAGVIQEKPLLETTAADFDQVIAINLRGSFLVGREALRWMQASNPKATDPARAILIASDMSYYGREQFSAYVASKHGVLGLVRSWSKEFAPAITVNAICPGPIETPLLMDWLVKDEEAKRIRLARNPTGRFGKPEEVVNMAIYLASDEARWTNGAAMVVDGGISVNYF